MAITAKRAQQVFERADLLYTAREVQAAIEAMAEAISERLGTANPVILAVMNGAMIPAGHLLTQLQFPLRCGYVHATRYRETTRGAEIDWIASASVPLAGESVLLIDDILDEGYTLEHLVRACRDGGAREVYSAVLVEKRHNRGNGFRADFVGLQVEDRYVFGFGMDYKGYLRNASGIYAAAAEDA